MLLHSNSREAGALRVSRPPPPVTERHWPLTPAPWKQVQPAWQDLELSWPVVTEGQGLSTCRGAGTAPRAGVLPVGCALTPALTGS